MLVKPVYQKLFEDALSGIHKARVNGLLLMSEALMNNASLSLTSLGRHLAGPIDTKHKIKRANYILGNKKLQAESFGIYQKVSELILKNLQSLLIAVDWSGCCSDENYVLRASLLYDGRSIPVYNEVHPAKLVGNRTCQTQFLKSLKELIPSNCKQVIIVTDAGFVTPWFKTVRALGWDFVGRVRGKVKYRQCEEAPAKPWLSIRHLHALERHKPTYRGHILLGKVSSAKLDCNLVTYRATAKGRKNKKRKGLPFFPSNERQYKKGAEEGLAIVTSLPYTTDLALRVVNIYKKRMQIEQNFRDDKSYRFGFSWRFSRCKNPKRISILCLIAFIATLLLWLIGFLAEEKRLHFKFQANTVKKQRVLSFLYLGKSILKDERYCALFNWRDLSIAMQNFHLHYSIP